MKEVIAIIRPGRWTATKRKLIEAGFSYTQCRVFGRGRQKGLRYLAASKNGTTAECGITYFPKRFIILAVPDERVDEAVGTLIEANRTGEIGDGKIFVSPMETAVRIRTRESGAAAVA